ncbi:hypothetical protein NXV13_22385 [Bacteroides ovatus]|nr:hypothetical protein [Bacteroides ovatus]
MGNVKEAKNLLKLAAELRGCYKDQYRNTGGTAFTEKHGYLYYQP